MIFFLSQTDPPQVILELGKATMSMQLIQEGNDIYFDCKIDSNPPVNKPIIWKFNGKILPPQQGMNSSINFSSFYHHFFNSNGYLLFYCGNLSKLLKNSQTIVVFCYLPFNCV